MKRPGAMSYVPYVIGVAVSFGMVGFYVGLLTLVSDWHNANLQFSAYRYWILALAGGLGIQAALYFRLRTLQRVTGKSTATSSLAASGGISTASMAACCSHYLVAFLPTLGIPFLTTAAAGVSEYQTEFFLVGVVSNVLGIGVMLLLLKKNGIPALKPLEGMLGNGLRSTRSNGGTS